MRFVTALRRLASPAVNISESSIHEVVGVLVESPSAAPSTAVEKQWINRGIVKAWEFCSAWVCLAAGLPLVGLLGGVPLDVVVAIVASFIGAFSIVFLDWYRGNLRQRLAV